MRATYIDANASTPIHPRVLKVLSAALRKNYANSASTHRLGRAAAADLDTALQRMARALDASPERMIVTSGATEAANLLINSLCRQGRRDLVVAPQIEHASVFRTLEHHATQRGLRLSVVKKPGGGSTDAVIAAVAKSPSRVRAVICQQANNEIGTLFDIQKIRRNTPVPAPVICDSTQSAMFLPSVAPHACTFFSGHKMYGPPGIGLATYPADVQLHPTIFGGGQQSGLRSGSVPVALVIGLAEAVVMCHEERKAFTAAANLLASVFLEVLGDSTEFRLVGSAARLPGSLSLTLPVRSSDLQQQIPDVCFSRGAACAGDSASHVLSAAGLDDYAIDRTIRVGFHPLQPLSIARKAALRIAAAVRTLRSRTGA